jgi:hypothetical protein
MCVAPYGPCWPARVRSVSRKWYVLVVWTTTLGMLGLSFWRRKGGCLVLFKNLSWGWRMRGTKMPYVQSVVTMAQNLKTLASKHFAMTWVLNTSSLVRIRLPRTAWWKGKIEPFVRWLGWCSMSIGLREGSELRRSIRVLCVEHDLSLGP